MKRRNETFNAAALIHGGTKTNKKPALDGLFDTLNKRCKLSDLANNICDVTSTHFQTQNIISVETMICLL